MIDTIYFGYGRWLIEGNESLDDYFRSILKYISSHKCFLLLKELESNSRDNTLKVFLISNLDNYSIDAYFSESDDLEKTAKNILITFEDLENNDIKNIFMNNPNLYGYVTLILQTARDMHMNEIDKSLYDNFFLRNKENMIIIEQINQFTHTIESEFDYSLERNLPFHKRDSARISRIVHEIANFQNIDEIFTIMIKKGILIDEEEENIAYYLLTNLILPNTTLKKTLHKMNI